MIDKLIKLATDGQGNAIEAFVSLDGKREVRLIEELRADLGEGSEEAILEGAKFVALHNIKIQFGELLVEFMGSPTKDERDTWERQRDWAKRYLNDGEEVAASLLIGLLTAPEREALGDTAPQVMAEKIMTKNAGAEQLISLAGGIRRTSEKLVEAATSIEEVETAIAQAHSMAAQAIAQVS